MNQTGSARARATVLLADNDAEFLKLQEKAFESEGFNVLTAVKPADAAEVLKARNVNAFVCDIRLEDDNDDKDISGLELAEKAPPVVGRVITTKFPHDVATGELFKDRIGRESPVLRYVDKSRGIPAIVEAAKKVTVFSMLMQNEDAVWDVFIGESRARRRTTTVVCITLLLLALGSGLLAASTGNVKFLFGTITLAVLTVVVIGRSAE